MNVVTLDELMAKPVCMMTGEELTLLLEKTNKGAARVSAEVTPELKEKQYVYGIQGIADTFGCSIPTANRIKASGLIDGAICQVGRKIVIDPVLAIELLKGKKIPSGNRSKTRNTKTG